MSVAAKKPPKTPKRKASNKPNAADSAGRKFVVTPLGITIISVSGALLAIFAAVSIYASAYGRNFPNIYVYGMNFGGMTQEETQTALSAKTDTLYSGTYLELSLDGQSITITAEEAGVSLSSKEAAEVLFGKGRSGSTFSRTGFAFSSFFYRRNLDGEIGLYIDREAIFEKVSSLCQESFVPPIEFSWTIGETAVTVTRGQDGFTSDPDEITSAVVNRFSVRDFSPLTFTSGPMLHHTPTAEELYDKIACEPKDASIELDDGGNAVVIPHTVGISFDINIARQRLEQNTPVFEIPLVKTFPVLTSEGLEENLFRDILGEYSTSASGSSSNRINNITLTTIAIDGTILMPGGEFSFNGVVGERTLARDYRLAGAYLNGRIVEAIGGGICQSSSTLYNAALLANLQIVSRQGHSMTVGYVPLGRDATVSYGLIDFVFANNTAYPIRIDARVENRRVYMQIWGTKTDDLTVEVENRILSSNPSRTITRYKPELAPNERVTDVTGSNGYTVQTYRIIKDADGREVSRNEEARTVYMRVDSIIDVGSADVEIPPDTPPPKPYETPDDELPPTDLVPLPEPEVPPTVPEYIPPPEPPSDPVL